MSNLTSRNKISNSEKQTVATEDSPIELDAWFGQMNSFWTKRIYKIRDSCARELVLVLLNRLKERKIIRPEYNGWTDRPIRPATYVNVPRAVCEVIVAIEKVDLTSEELRGLRQEPPEAILRLLGVRKLLFQDCLLGKLGKNGLNP
jgi:hypothetical protein